MFTGVGLPPRGGSRMAGTSRMSREAHVRICGGLEVKFLRSTRPAASCRSPSYQLKVRFRVHTGRPATKFRMPISERLLFPKAVVQITEKSTKRQAANGQYS